MTAPAVRGRPARCASRWRRAATVLAAALALPVHAHLTADELRDGVGFTAAIGARMPLDARFTDEAGHAVSLADVVHGHPTLVAIVYYDCRDLCPITLGALRGALRDVGLAAGRDFAVAAVSIDPAETPADAARARSALAARDRPSMASGEALRGWHFLTADAAAIDRFTRALGFRYRRDDESAALAHPSGVVLLTPDGAIASYRFGVTFTPTDLRHGIIEASRGMLGTLPDRVWLLCHRFDPQTGRYESLIVDAVRAGALASALALGGGILWLSGAPPLRRRSRRREPVSHSREREAAP